MGDGVSLFLGGLFFLAWGLFIRLSRTQLLLDLDRMTGYYLYKQKLAETGDERLAVEAAGTFYHLFGMGFVVVGVLMSAVGALNIVF